MFSRTKKQNIYLDHASSTPLAPKVREAMAPYLEDRYGNPSSLHELGRQAKVAISAARESVAKRLNAKADEIIFTSSGSASDNLAIMGAVQASKVAGKHIITTCIEHHAVLRPFEYLKNDEGVGVTILAVNEFGIVDIQSLKNAIQPETVLVSVMYANNEIGTIEPIQEIGRQLKRINKERVDQGLTKILFHVDACQAVNFLPLDVEKLSVDLLTFNSSKIYGPKGVGALYIRRGVKLEPLIYGGGQEKGLIAGTENVAGIVGLAVALELVRKSYDQESERQTKLRDKLIAGILKTIPGAKLNGHSTERLANNVNISIPGVDGEALVIYLSEYGIYVGTGSACESSSDAPSHVLKACGVTDELIISSLRLTLGRETEEKDIDYVLKVLPKVVELLRQ